MPLQTHHNECVGFESRWTVVRKQQENGVQTTENVPQDRATSPKAKVSAETQTEPMEFKEGQIENEENLAKFLTALYPEVSTTLSNNTSNPGLYNELLDDEKDLVGRFATTHMQTIEPPVEDGAIPTSHSKTIKAVTMSWNCTGRLLAVAYTYEHGTWCHHPGTIRIYSIMNVTDTFDTTSSRKLHTSNCVTNVCFHPVDPTFIAASTFTGEVYFWDIERNADGDDTVLFKMEGHNELITTLTWIRNPQSPSHYFVASGCIDGFLNIWDFLDSTFKQRFKFRMPILHSMRSKHRLSASPTLNPKLSVLCFDFSVHSPDLFVVGLIGGLIAQCSTVGGIQLKSRSDDETDLGPVYDPIVQYYEPLKGEVGTVAISPHRSDIFLAAGTDNEICIYVFGQSEPVQVLFSKNMLCDVIWVPDAEKLIAACGNNGVLEMFNMISESSEVKLENTLGPNSFLTRIAVNPVNKELLTVGCTNGNIQYLKLSWGSDE